MIVPVENIVGTLTKIQIISHLIFKINIFFSGPQQLRSKYKSNPYLKPRFELLLFDNLSNLASVIIFRWTTVSILITDHSYQFGLE